MHDHSFWNGYGTPIVRRLRAGEMRVVATDKFSPEFVIVSDKVIAVRAHEIYVERGCADGCDRDDWLRAERALTSPPIAERVIPRSATRR